MKSWVGLNPTFHSATHCVTIIEMLNTKLHTVGYMCCSCSIQCVVEGKLCPHLLFHYLIHSHLRQPKIRQGCQLQEQSLCFPISMSLEQLSCRIRLEFQKDLFQSNLEQQRAGVKFAQSSMTLKPCPMIKTASLTLLHPFLMCVY